MSYKEIDFMSRGEIQSLDGDSETIVISITSPGLSKALVCSKFKDILYQEFDNTDHLSNRFVRFNQTHANEILSFVEKNKDSATKIVVNCMMGESRSAAVALFLASKFDLPLKRDTSKHIPWIFRVFEKTDRNYLRD